MQRRPARRSVMAASMPVLAVLAGACRKPATTTPPPPPADPAAARSAADASPRLMAETTPVEPDVCHASVGWRDGRFESIGLPCVSRDGSEILFARSDERPGSPELTVVAVTRADRLSRYAVVMEPHERGELLDAARRPTPELQARIVKANVLLDEASRRAVPLAAFAATPAATHAGRGLEVAWTEKGRLTISREGRFVHEGDHGDWLEPPGACAPYLDKVWGDAARGVLLVRLAYRGGAGCAAPPALHVVSWTPSPGAS